MELSYLEKFAGDLTDTAAGNFIGAGSAINESCVGLRMFERPIFGVSDARDALYEKFREPGVVGPQFMTPEQWLPGARSVVCFFLPFTEAVRASNRGDIANASPEWQHGRSEGNRFVGDAARALVRELVSLGYAAAAPVLDSRFKATDDPAAGVFTSNWSERHAAYASGLGTFGMSAGLITRKGMAGRCASIVTDAVLAPTPREYTGIYDWCIRCGACRRNCPADAIDMDRGKDHALCSAVMRESTVKFAPRCGCGKCQVGVPCEHSRPSSPKD